MEHIIVRVYDGLSTFVCGCTCDWVGPVRHNLQVSVADEITHKADVVPCDEPGCPIEACRRSR